ncbi:MAG: hypothetical protein CMF62_06230 [Magnetococcales bacterium]|nr:hypothetical protein [Magnetococcales bacterium]
MPIDATIKKIADTCGVDFTWLKTGKGAKPTSSKVNFAGLDNQTFKVSEIQEAMAFMRDMEEELDVTLPGHKAADVLVALMAGRREGMDLNKGNVIPLFKVAS